MKIISSICLATMLAIGCQGEHKGKVSNHKSSIKREFVISSNFSDMERESYFAIWYALNNYKDNYLSKPNSEVKSLTDLSNANLDFVLLKSHNLLMLAANNGIPGQKIGTTYYIEFLPQNKYTKTVQRATYIEYGDSTKFSINDWYKITFTEYKYYDSLYNFTQIKERYKRTEQF